jgi:hypothetical protein
MSKAGVKQYHATVIHPDGSVEYHTQDGKFSLERLQGFVKGYIERVDVRVAGKNYEMFVNEEGLLHGLPLNPTATLLVVNWIVQNKFRVYANARIVGTTVVLSRDHLEGKL